MKHNWAQKTKQLHDYAEIHYSNSVHLKSQLGSYTYVPKKMDQPCFFRNIVGLCFYNAKSMI